MPAFGKKSHQLPAEELGELLGNVRVRFPFGMQEESPLAS